MYLIEDINPGSRDNLLYKKLLNIVGDCDKADLCYLAVINTCSDCLDADLHCRCWDDE